MNNEATININGQEIRMLYTAAAEKGFEDMTGQSSAVFMSNGKIYDWVTLGLACIVAAYAKQGEEPPVKSEDILYNWGPDAVESLIKTTIELRRAWYKIPEVIKTEGKTLYDYEGCLSVPTIYGKVPRPAKARIKAVLEDGTEVRLKAQDFLARTLLHEIDHLNGILFIDHIKDQTDAFYKLDDKGDLVPLDYDKYIKDNKELWPDDEE